MKDDSLGVDEYTTVFNGKYYPRVRKYTLAPPIVQSGQSYTFKVQALNFNGVGQASSTAQFSVCVVPAGLFPPKLVMVTKDESDADPSNHEISMTLQWEAPDTDGGCPVLSYHIFMAEDDGSSPLVEVDAADVNDKPTLRSHTLVFPIADAGKTYKVRLEVSNEIAPSTIGKAAALETTFVLAAVPSQPSGVPTIDYSGTSRNAIKIDYAALPVSENGGSEILSYELQIYNYDDAVGVTCRR
jgi:hypothetical protein